MSVGPKLAAINCAGGLNKVATTLELFQNPGLATELMNFESGINGGYRRINGYALTSGATQPAGNSNEILGVFAYADGIIAVQESTTNNYNIYFSVDEITWIQVNKTMSVDYATGDDATQMALNVETTRGSGDVCHFVLYEGETSYGEVAIMDGVNLLAIFKLEGSGAGRTYHYTELATPGDVRWGEMYKDKLVVGGDTSNPDTIYWSNLYDITDFTGANAGSIDLPSKITGIKAWRDRLFAFGKTNIDEISGLVSGIAGTAAVENISKNIGCLCGCSIQEVGGDVVFLSVDGFRNLGGTARIDDIALTAISRPVDPVIKNILANFDSLRSTSMVIRSKNQYRFFYTNSLYPDDQQFGIVGTVRMGPEGPRWEWSEIQGIPVSVGSGSIPQQTEKIYHGGYDGYIYQHDTGNSFNGGDIFAYYESPELDYGNIGARHTLHWMKLSANIEGLVENIKIRTTFNFSDTEATMQPNDITLEQVGDVALYGTGTYGTSAYSGAADLERRVSLIGAGFTNKFRFYSEGTQAPYSIYSYFVKYHEGAIQ